MIEALSSARLPAPVFRYSALVRAGPFYQSAGMIALDPATGKLEPGGAGAEAARILANLLGALPDFALSLDDLMSTTIYTTDFGRFADINAAWEAVFVPGQRPPARTSIGVAALPLGAAVEMDFLFYKPE